MSCLGGASQTGTGICQSKQMTKQREETKIKKVKFISAANSRNLGGSGHQPRLVLNRGETKREGHVENSGCNMLSGH